MGNGYIIDNLTSVAIQENVKFRGKVIQIFGGVIHWENFEVSQLWKVREKLFAIGQKHKDEINNLMQKLVYFLMKSL